MRRNNFAILCLGLLVSFVTLSTAQEVKKKIFTGRVIDYNARPVADATVVCYKSDYELNQRSYEHLKQVKTTSDGRFFLQVETKDSSPVLVAGKQGLALGWRQIYSGSEPIIRLGRPSQFKGIVVDSAGHPVPGAKVRICLKNEMITRREIAPLLPKSWFTTKTDANGQFLFDNVPEGATADFGAEAPGRALIWTTCDFGPGQGEQFTAGRTDIRIVLPPEASIKGQVIEEETGEPIAGIRILTRPYGRAGWYFCPDPVQTDPNGRFELTGLAPNKYLLRVISDKEGSGNLTVDVEPGQTVSDIIVSLTGCPLEVIVYDAEKGGPIEDAKVTIKQIQAKTKYTTYSQQLTTDAKGLARFCAPPGECEVQVIKLDYGAIFQPQRVQLEVGQKTRHEVSLPRTAIGLSGEVSDEQGNAISGALVMHQSFGLGFSTLTDANGHFDTNDIHFFSSRLPSSVRVLAQHIPSGLGAAGVLRDPTRTGKPQGRIILKPAYVLTGSVTDPAGRSIPAAYVKLLTGSSNAIVSEVATDPNGFYYIRSVPPPGDKLEYAIVAYAEGFGQTAANRVPFHNDTTRPVHLDPIVLLTADQVISGIVEDSNDQPVAGVSVWVCGLRTIRNYRQMDYGETLTDEQGRFRIAGVCKEPLRIYARSPSPQQQPGEIWAHGGNENIRVVLGQKLIFSPSLIGKALPDLKDLKIDLPPADVSDKMLLVCFWDMQQRPSRNCIMRLARQSEQLKQKGVAVVAIQASKIDENELNELIKKYNIPFTVGMINGDVEKNRFTWGVKSLPWLILTNWEQTVIAEGFGIDELDEQLKKNIDPEHAIQKNKPTPTKPLAQTGLSDPAKSFLDAGAILAGWESSYAGIKTMRVSYCTRLVDYQPPACNPNEPPPVKYMHVERVEQGNRFHIRYSTAEDGFDRPESLMEHAFDGKITREYLARGRHGSIVEGLIGRNTETMNHLKVYMLLRRRLVGGRNESGTYLIEDPNSKPDLSRTLSYAIPRSMISVLPKLEYVGSQLCHVIEVTVPGKDHKGIPRQIKQVFWIANDKGMCLIKYQWYWDNTLDMEIEVEQIAMAKMDNTDVWYPKKAYRTIFSDEIGTIKCELTVTEFIPNVEVDEKTFRFDFPKGTYVFDRVRGITGVDLPKEPPSLVGKPVPELDGIKIDIPLEDVKAKNLLVCFWDMQQRPSRNCIRELAKRAEELKEKGVAVIAVQASKVDDNELNEWVKKNNIPFPVGIVQGDEEQTNFAWGVRSLPWLILTNRKHIVRAEGFALTEIDEKISAIAQKQN